MTDPVGSHVFARARAQFDDVVGFLGGQGAAVLTHAELEAELGAKGRELLRQLYQDHLDLRAEREVRLPEVVGSDGAARRYAEAGHARPLATVFGEVTVGRLAYRRKGEANLHPADGALKSLKFRIPRRVDRYAGTVAGALSGCVLDCSGPAVVVTVVRMWERARTGARETWRLSPYPGAYGAGSWPASSTTA